MRMSNDYVFDSRALFVGESDCDAAGINCHAVVD